MLIFTPNTLLSVAAGRMVRKILCTSFLVFILSDKKKSLSTYKESVIFMIYSISINSSNSQNQLLGGYMNLYIHDN